MTFRAKQAGANHARYAELAFTPPILGPNITLPVPMTLFIALAALLVLFTILVLGVSVWREDPQVLNEPGLVERNIAIARASLATLDVAHASGTINDAEYAEERARIELTLATELDPDTEVKRSRKADVGLIMMLVLVVPASAAWLYSEIGTPAAIDPSLAQVDVPDNREMPSMPELIASLEQRLEEDPEDITGWRMLGRTHLAMSEFDKASDALARALEIEANDLDTMASLAEARAMAAGGNLTDESVTLLEQAFALDDQHEQTLWLLGVARQQAGRHEEALTLFGTLRAIANANGNSQGVATIDEYASRSQIELGVAPASTAESQSSGGASITVSVSLGDTAGESVSPDTPVFIFARAASGPPMPLAVQRLTAADLPVTLTLDETMAMIPNMTLAAFPEVIVGARASMTGEPTASPGDWSIEQPALIGESGTPDSPMVLEITTQIP